MFKLYRFILIMFATAMLLSGFASASTTVWTINDAAQPVPHSYMGTDWIGYISFGQNFELLQTRDDYAQLRNSKGNIGWVDRENLVYFDPNDLNQVMFAQADGNILWPQAQFEENPVQLKKGDLVHVVGVTPHKKWYRVVYKNKYYYAPCELLADSPAPEQGAGFIVTQRYVFGKGVDLYSTEDETAQPLASIADGTPVRLLEARGHMVKIQTGENQIGFTQMINLVKLDLY